MAKKKKEAPAERVNLNRSIPLLAIILICAAIFLFFLFQWINTRSQRNEIKEETEIINPQDSMPVQTKMATLYFRYENGDYLAREIREVTSRPDEQMEAAVIRELVNGPSEENTKLNQLLPEETSVEKIEIRGETIYITFNRDLLRRDRVDGNTKEMNRKLMLMTRSIVNTVLDLGNYSGVQLLIDEKEDGIGERLSIAQFGFVVSEQEQKSLLPILFYDMEDVLVPEVMLNNIVQAINNQDWQALYQLVLVAGRPTFTEARTKWKNSEFTVEEYTVINSITGANDETILRVNIRGKQKGSAVEYLSFPVILTPNEGIWQVSYRTLERLMVTESQEGSN